MVIEKALAGPVGLFVKFSTLQEYGVDKIFFLENDNVDSSQRNVIFLVRAEDVSHPIAVAGMSYSCQVLSCYRMNARYSLFKLASINLYISALYLFSDQYPIQKGTKVDCVDLSHSTRSVLFPNKKH